MLQVSQLRLPVDHSDKDLRRALSKILGIKPDFIRRVKVKQRAVDARKRDEVLFCYTLLVEVDREQGVLKRAGKPGRVELVPDETYRELPEPPAPEPEKAASSEGTPAAPAAPVIHKKPRVVVVGTGPCGLLCGLLLARQGFKPILLERGKAAGPRARDVTGFWRRGLDFNSDSNVQFGEGGAGTFSDGKLYTQIRDREHRIPWILRELVKAGAPEDILVKSRPHIGTDRLIKVVRTIREEIIALGGEVRFETRVKDVVLEKGVMRAVVTAAGETIEADKFVFAIGHSSRDTFEALHAKGVPFEAKPFSVGVRIEHPQGLVDRSQFGQWAGAPKLGAAAYKFAVHAATGRTAYSFCMCPGGLVVAATSEPDMVVTNGMSSYARAESNANAGFMVDVKPEDFPANDPLGGIKFQRALERKAFAMGGSNYRAPAQLLEDFIKGKASTGQGKVKPSYEPGVTWGNLHDLLPDYVCETLIQSVPLIEKGLRGFSLPDAVLTGAETRSSSPVRIPRDPETCECVSVKNFLPAGEGAGYAGGIISAAVDGMRVAEILIHQAV
ncbi:FAD-dependent protein [Roseimicrobium sp. ORNL1]|uniref:NAD(P)/FAD-dependent oxidoreductase n=1 Tax=Roseimicrobium sp. ORNL1 TaxID=2711231 RepID=UPI0013E1465C|nr:FAD-dependent monooxygenase [Roseimicrobium sp. ORNL1]QIF02996.1 hypothetical protein G5S37_16190 [Roseimicrobium sp. ORNL1]